MNSAIAVLASLTAAVAWAPPLRAQLAEKGELLLEENFQRYAVYTKAKQPVKDGWQARVAHGTWTRTAEGVQSTWQEGHSPVLVFEGSFGDVVVELDFRYHAEPGKWAACRVSATNTVLNPRAYSASVWANTDFKSRAIGLVLEHDEWSGHITQVSRKLMEFAPDVWHTLRLEIVGDKASATCDGTTISGAHEKYGLPKNSLWLATGMSPHELRHLRVYAARPAEKSSGAAPTTK